MEFIAYDPTMRAGLVDMFKNADDHYKSGMLSLIDEHPHNAIVLEHEGTILSAAAHTAERGDKRANFSAYTGERFRHEGIGQTIAKATICNMIGLGVRTMYADFPKCDGVADFARKTGFCVAFDSHYMAYRGGRIETEAHVVPYTPNMYDAYRTLESDVFSPLREANGIMPARLPHTEDERARMESEATDYFVLMDEGVLAGAGRAAKGELDNIAVAADKRRKGVGRALVAYGVNKLIDEGYDEIGLWVMDGNRAAMELYEAMGFCRLRTNTYCVLELTRG